MLTSGKLRLLKIGDVPVPQSRRCRLSRMAVRSSRPVDRADDFVIAVNEIAANAVRYGPPAARRAAGHLYRFKTDRMVFDLGFMRSVTQPCSTR